MSGDPGDENDNMSMDIVMELIERVKKIPSKGRLLYFRRDIDTGEWEPIYLSPEKDSIAGYRADGCKMDGGVQR